MKGILLIRESPKYSMGGIQGKVLSIAKHLKEQGRYLPILGTSDADSLFSNEFKKLGLSVYELPMRERKGIKKSVEIFENYILKEHDVHIIQSHNFRESITGRAIRKKHPELKHIFRVHTHIDGGTISSVRKIFYRILDGITSKEVDVFVPISVTVEKELLTKSRIPKEKIRVLFNGIPPLGPPDPPDRSEAGLKREIAIAGDLQKRKNQAMAVESIAMLRDKGIYVKLHLIGGDREGYKKMIMDVAKLHAVTDQVHMHGYKKRSEIYDIIKDVPVIVLPSLFEGMPTSIIEGMSLRKIVVATPVGGTEELIENGVNGFLHRPLDVGQLSEVLVKIFTSPAHDWESMRNAAYSTWQSKFKVQQMMDGLNCIYDELIANEKI